VQSSRLLCVHARIFTWSFHHHRPGHTLDHLGTCGVGSGQREPDTHPHTLARDGRDTDAPARGESDAGRQSPPALSESASLVRSPCRPPLPARREWEPRALSPLALALVLVRPRTLLCVLSVVRWTEGTLARLLDHLVPTLSLALRSCSQGLLSQVVPDLLQQRQPLALFLAGVDGAVESSQGTTVVHWLGILLRWTALHLHATSAPPGTRLACWNVAVDQPVLVQIAHRILRFRLTVNGS